MTDAPKPTGPSNRPARASSSAGHPAKKPLPEEVRSAGGSARIGDYVRVHKIGTGSMGDVYKAWDLHGDRWVALKILRSNDPTTMQRFVREAQVASQLEHPNITRIHDAGKDPKRGLWYIAMQLIVGHTFRAFPRSNRRIVVELMRDAARALDFAHKKGVVHRDVKPENFMVSSAPKEGAGDSKALDAFDHHMYVMDFGIARPADATTQLTMPGTIMGSPSFMSPEQAMGRTVDLRGDVYSLGATLYERLTGAPPFPGKNMFETLRRVQEEVPPTPSALDATIDGRLSGIVMKCLEKDAGKRYQTAAEFADALDGWLQAPPEAATKKKGGCGKAVAVIVAVMTGIAVAAGN